MDEMKPSPTVKVNDEEYTIERFRGFKAVLVIALITRIARKVPNVIAKATRDFRRNNSLEITPMMAKLEQWVGNTFTEEDYGEKGYVEVPAPMSGQEQLLQALPDLLEGAHQEVFKLMALLLTNNAELREADKKDQAYKILEDKADPLYDADLGELAELLATGLEIVNDQIGDTGDRLGKQLRRIPWVNRMFFQEEKLLPQETPASEESTQKTSQDGVQISSTDSELPTGGTETQPSTEPLGVS